MCAFTGSEATSIMQLFGTRKADFMGEIALDLEEDCLAVEGFDELLDEREPGSARGSTKVSEDQAKPKPGLALGSAEGVPVDEAARRLGISTNAILKRLRKGKLRGRKVSGQFGAHWLVDISDIPEAISIEVEAEPGSAQGSTQTEGEPAEDKPGSASAAPPDRERELLQLVVRLSKENGALQALLNEREQQIKLLTDNQRKAGGWSRFWIWFTGGRGSTDS